MLQAEDRIRPESPDFGLEKTKSDDGQKKRDLPIEQPWQRQIAADRVVDGEIDERRGRPDVFFVWRHAAQLPRDPAAEHAGRQRSPFAVLDRRKRAQTAS